MKSMMRIMKKQSAGRCLAVLLVAAAPGANDGPDITVSRIAGETSDYNYYGFDGDIAAYSMGTTACNPGTVPVNWTTSDHPVIGQNFFRLRNGLFEHIGQSWLKHGFCAVSEPSCGACQDDMSCDLLGVGCADTYNSGLNDGRFGGPKWQIDAATGIHPDPHPFPTGPNTIRGRLQVRIADIDPTLPENQDAFWFSEGQYVSAHDAQNGNSANNNSWQLLHVVSFDDIQTGGSTEVGQPGIFAWHALDPEVLLEPVVNWDEGGVGAHGYFWVASRAYDLGGGTWRYVYAVQNLTSKRSAASISIPLTDAVTAGAFYFHDVEYHSGEPFDGTDWSASQANGAVSFACTQTYAQNPNANAVRWGTLYTFAFEADSPPQVVAEGGMLGLFEPGAINEIRFQAYVPGGEPPVGTAFCSGDGSGAFCPCFNFGDADRGCGNATFTQGTRLAGTGQASVGNDTVTLSATQSSPSQPGLFFQGDLAVGGGAGIAFGDGLRCAGQNVVRLETVTASPSGEASTSVGISATGGIQAGDLRRYQFWYRDSGSSPCGTGFNLSNGLEIAWAP